MISSLIFFSALFAHANIEATYCMKWTHKGVPIETKMYEGPLSLLTRVGETGEFKGRDQFAIMNELLDGKIKARPGDTKIVILIIKNNSSKPLKFAVAPHSVAPIEASLGIKFTCLCNGHTYNIAPNSSWYRILLLKTLAPVEASAQQITLEHQIFPVK